MAKANLNSLKDKFKKTVESVSDLTTEATSFVKENVDNEKINNFLKKTGESVKQVTDKVKEIDSETIKQNVGQASQNVKQAATVVKEKAGIAVQVTKSKAVDMLDENGDGVIGIEDIIIKSMKLPGIKIDRANFLRNELYKKYPEVIINDAILKNPMEAGIDSEDIDKIADDVIEYERNLVSGISAALGMPGGLAIAATIPADIAQYYGYMLRAAQKLLYLYGFPQIEFNSDENYMDSETINILTLCLGVMYGVAGANNALKSMAKALATGVEKKLLNAALTKGTFYPMVKKIAGWFGKRMTKQVFAGFFKGAIPVIGGVIGGGLTYASFKPCCVKLQTSLKDTRLSNKNYKEDKETAEFDIVETD